jgi:hypothetical protein
MPKVAAISAVLKLMLAGLGTPAQERSSDNSIISTKEGVSIKF